MNIPTWSLAALPPILSRWLGYRDPSRPAKTHAAYQISFWSFLASWIGIALLMIIGTYSPQLAAYHSPLIIASFGASAVLVYGSIDAPLSQPRNAFFGHIIGALVGVIISKLFLQLADWTGKQEQHEVVQWVAGATAVALAIVLMQYTVTVHPPGGATALIATVDDKVMAMGWYYIGVIAASASVMIVVACLVNNMDRKYPLYWWRPNKMPLAIDPANLATSLPTAFSRDEEELVDQSCSTLASARQIVIDPNQTLVWPKDVLDEQDIKALKIIQDKLAHSK